MSISRQESGSNIVRVALAQLAILLVLFVWMFRPQLTRMTRTAISSSEWVHVLLTPIMIALLAYHRREALAARISKGSFWGAVLLIAGLTLYSVASWPLSYGYVRDITMIPILAGIVLVTCGWGALRLSLPMLLLVVLAIPVSERIYARLIIRPETYTIQGVAAVLDGLPCVKAFIKGVDIFFESSFGRGVVALGQSNRGVRLPAAFAVVGGFAVFSQIRPIGRLVITACAAIPIILFCNFFRLLCWGLLEVYVSADPTSSTPRNVSAILSLFLSYALFLVVCTMRANLFLDIDKDLHCQEDARA